MFFAGRTFSADALRRLRRPSHNSQYNSETVTLSNAGLCGYGGIQACSKALHQIFDPFSMVCCSAYTYRSTTQPQYMSLSVYHTEQGIDTKYVKCDLKTDQTMLAGVVVGESSHLAKPLIKYLMHFPWYAAAHIRTDRQPSPIHVKSI